MSNFAKTEAGQKYAMNMQAIQRLAQPEDIGLVVAFLASPGSRFSGLR
jgi:3-oxoacyl-[acyl-carrier protein] reductase